MIARAGTLEGALREVSACPESVTFAIIPFPCPGPDALFHGRWRSETAE
jgi:hypothetical protein